MRGLKVEEGQSIIDTYQRTDEELGTRAGDSTKHVVVSPQMGVALIYHGHCSPSKSFSFFLSVFLSILTYLYLNPNIATL